MYFAGAGQAIMTVASVAAVCMIFGLPALKILGLWLEKEISGPEAIVGVGVLIVFLGGIVRAWGEPEGILLWLLAILLAIAIILGTRASNKHRLNEFFGADVASANRALAKDPENAAAHMRLAGLYDRQGDIEKAIPHYEHVVRLVPRDSESRLCLANAIEKRRREVTGSLVCWKCGRENADCAAYCAECGVLISDKNQIIGWLTSKQFVRANMALGAASVLCAAIGSIFRSVPWTLTAFAYLLLFLTVLCYLYPRWVRARDD